MKKVLCLLIALTMALGCFSISASAAEYGIVLNNNVAILVGSTTAVANNTLQTLQAAPIADGDEVLVPLSAISALLNGTVSHDGATGIINIGFGTDKVAVMRTGTTQYTLNGRGYDLPVAPRVENGVVMVPVISIVEDIIGQEVFYDRTTQLVVISSRRVLKDSVTDAAVISAIANAIRTGVLPPISVPTSYELDWSVTTPTGGNASNDQGQLKFVSVTASSEPESQNPAVNVNDGNTATIWAVDGSATLVGDIGKLNNVTEIKVAFTKFTERSANYSLAVSADNKNYETIFSGSSTMGQQWDSHKVNGAYRYVKMIPNGTSAGTWNSVAEIQVWNGASDTGSQAPVGTPISSSTYTYKASSEPEVENGAGNAFDSNSGTFWATQGTQDMTIDLGSSKMVTAVSVEMRYYDDGRSINYSVGYSNDGSSYETVFSGACAPGGGSPETYPIGVETRYIKIGTNGSSIGDWASVSEIVVYGEYVASAAGTAGGTTVAQGSAIKPSSYRASAEPEAANPAANAFDGNASTVWAAQGNQNMVIDLGSVQSVSSVGVQMKQYDDTRTVNYGVEVSEDGSNYTSCFNGSSAAGGGVMENQAVGKSARYVRVTVNGNSINDWASVAEIAVYGGAAASTTAAGYKNLDNISGEFMLAVAGTTNVLSVSGDTALTVGSTQQKWVLEGSSVKNVTNGKFMDVFNQSYDEGGEIGVWDGNGGTNQQWTFEKEGDGYYVKSVMSGLYLTAVGTAVQQRSKASATKWTVTDGSMNTVTAPAGGGYKNMSSISGEFMLAVAGTTDVLAVSGDTALTVGSGQQKWTLSGAAVKSSTNGKVLDVFNQSYDEGGEIGVWDDNGGTNQQWTFENAGDGYLIKNAMSGLYLSYMGGRVQQLSSGSATKWVVTDGTMNTVAVPGVDGTVAGPDINAMGEFVLSSADGQILTLANDGYSVVYGPYTSSDFQKWTQKDGVITNSATGERLGIADNSVGIGIMLCVGGNNTGSLRWIFENEGNGLIIKNKNSGLYITLDDNIAIQRARAAATVFNAIEVGSAGEVSIPVTSEYQNLDSITGNFIMVPTGTNNAVSVGADNYALTTGAYTGDARQQWTLDGYAVKNVGLGTYLDVSGESMDAGAQIGVWEGNGGLNQRWVFERDDNGYYIKSNLSGLYLGIVGGNAQQVARANATKFIIASANVSGSAGVQTTTPVTPTTNGYANMDSISGSFMLAVYGSNDVLSVNSDNFSLGVGAAGDKSMWSLDGAGIKNNGAGIFLDVSDQSMEEGGAIIVWEGNGGTNQQWTFEKDNDGYYIKSVMSGLYLTVVGGDVKQMSRANATKWVVTNGGAAETATTPTTVTGVTSITSKYTNMTSVSGDFIIAEAGSDNVLTVGADNMTLTVNAYSQDAKQQWTLDGASFKNIGSGLYMDVSGQSHDEGGAIIVWEGNGGDNQMWIFEKDGDSAYYIKSLMSGLYLSVVGGSVQQVSKANATRWIIAAK